MSMFGVIVSGRLVQTDFQQVDETKFLINIPDADNINYVVVFMTGAQPFPNELGGSVYFSWPDHNAPPSWQYLGFISNAKPSAIFKISKLKPEQMQAGTPFSYQQTFSHVAQIGISVEPLAQIQLQTPNSAANPSTTHSFTEFATKMLENFYNYAASFGVTQAQMVPNPTETFIPMSTLQQWYTTFQRRLQERPNFWKS